MNENEEISARIRQQMYLDVYVYHEKNTTEVLDILEEMVIEALKSKDQEAAKLEAELKTEIDGLNKFPANGYPNIEAIAKGCISGEFREWSVVKPEAQALLREVERLKSKYDIIEKEGVGKLIEESVLLRSKVEKAIEALKDAQKMMPYGLHSVDEALTYLEGKE